jgi:hypothetical protein
MSIRGKDAEAFIEAARRAGLPITEQGVNVAALTGDTDTDTKGTPLPSCRVKPGVYLIGVATASESNTRGHWSKRNGRKAGQMRAVSGVLGRHLKELAPIAEHYHQGGTINITLTRLAPRMLDKANLYAAMKGIEDICALICGANDGDPRWKLECGQEKSERVGVRIELQPAEA